MDLVRAEYIPDDINDIRQTVLRLKERVGPDGVIFSSGGIGPTHDDVTYEALASAFGAPCSMCTNADHVETVLVVMLQTNAACFEWCRQGPSWQVPMCCKLCRLVLC